MCMHIHNSPFCVCVCTWIWCVCVCVWFLCNIPNLSNFGPRWEALLFSWRSRRATKTVVHFGNRLKLWTSNAAHSNNLSWLSFKWLWTWTWAVNVRVDMDVGAKPLTMPTTGQFKRRPQGSKNKCYCTFRLHVLAAAAPIQCLIFRAVVFTPTPLPPSPLPLYLLLFVCFCWPTNCARWASGHP